MSLCKMSSYLINILEINLHNFLDFDFFITFPFSIFIDTFNIQKYQYVSIFIDDIPTIIR